MAVLGLVKDWLGKNQCGQPDNVGQTFFCGFCYISATKEPSQSCNLVSGLQLWSASILRSNPCPPPTLHPSPLVILLARPTAQIFYLIWWETLQAATSTGSGLKGNRLMHL